MKTTTNATLILLGTALAIVLVFFLLFGFGAISAPMGSGGWPSGMMGGTWMGTMNWMWIPTFVTLGLGILLSWMIIRTRAEPVKAKSQA